MTSASPNFAKQIKNAIAIAKEIQENGKNLKGIDSRNETHNQNQEQTVKEIVLLVPIVIKFVTAVQNFGGDPSLDRDRKVHFAAIVESVKALSALLKLLTFATGRESFTRYA
jgi:hypothetical protein